MQMGWSIHGICCAWMWSQPVERIRYMILESSSAARVWTSPAVGLLTAGPFQRCLTSEAVLLSTLDFCTLYIALLNSRFCNVIVMSVG